MLYCGLAHALGPKQGLNMSKGHKWFAAFYDRLSRAEERRGMGDWRQRTVGDVKGNVLEIGVGTGLNLSHYKSIEKLTALEPDPYMRQRLEARLKAASFPIEVLPIGGEELPFPDASFDYVVATLVYCTVPDAARSLREVRRVLKPEGELRFVEHVRSESRPIALLLTAITPLWAQLGGGCHPNRDTLSVIRDAGFEVPTLHRFSLGMLPHIAGSAKRW